MLNSTMLISEYIQKKIIDVNDDEKYKYAHSVYCNSKTGYKEIYLTKDKEKGLLIIGFEKDNTDLKKLIFMPISFTGKNVIYKDTIFLDSNILSDLSISSKIYKNVLNEFKVLELQYNKNSENINYLKLNKDMIDFISEILDAGFRRGLNIKEKINKNSTSGKLIYSERYKNIINDFIDDLSVYSWKNFGANKNHDKWMLWINKQYGFDFSVLSVDQESKHISNMRIHFHYPETENYLVDKNYRFVISFIFNFSEKGYKSRFENFYIQLIDKNNKVDVDKENAVNFISEAISELNFINFKNNIDSKAKSIQFLCAMSSFLNILRINELCFSKANNLIDKFSVISPFLDNKEVLKDMKIKSKDKIINKVICF